MSRTDGTPCSRTAQAGVGCGGRTARSDRICVRGRCRGVVEAWTGAGAALRGLGLLLLNAEPEANEISSVSFTMT